MLITYAGNKLAPPLNALSCYSDGKEVSLTQLVQGLTDCQSTCERLSWGKHRARWWLYGDASTIM